MPAASRTRERMPSAPTTSRAVTPPPSSKRSLAAVRVPADRRDRTRRVGRDAGRAYERHERCAKRPLLDDPRERPLAHIVGVEIEDATVVTEDAHRFDRGQSIGGQRLPGPEPAQECRAARTDRVDARIPVVAFRRLARGRDRLTIAQRDREPRRRERRGKREADETRPRDQHVAVGVQPRPASVAHAFSFSSTSIT